MTQRIVARVVDFVPMGFSRWSKRWNRVVLNDTAEAYTRDGRAFHSKCGACDGTGHRSEFAHVEGGRCWKCSGRGVLPIASLRAYVEGAR